MLRASLSGKYTLTCTSPDCDGFALIEQDYGVGWKLGDIVAMDPTNQFYARCHRCKSHNMKVTKVPESPRRPGPKGFTKIPTE